MNPELEKLIDLALADGVLTEKEKQILTRKAQEFGVDMDEFEMVLDAKLHLSQKENTKTTTDSTETDEQKEKTEATLIQNENSKQEILCGTCKKNFYIGITINNIVICPHCKASILLLTIPEASIQYEKGKKEFNCVICKKGFYADITKNNMVLCPHCKVGNSLPKEEPTSLPKKEHALDKFSRRLPFIIAGVVLFFIVIIFIFRVQYPETKEEAREMAIGTWYQKYNSASRLIIKEDGTMNYTDKYLGEFGTPSESFSWHIKVGSYNDTGEKFFCVSTDYGAQWIITSSENLYSSDSKKSYEK